MSQAFRDMLKKGETSVDDKKGMVVSIFFQELDNIQTEEIRRFTKDILILCVPDYFWESPASYSGKHHHPDEVSDGSLAEKHTKRVFNVAKLMMQALGWFSHTGDRLKEDKIYDHDVILSACLLHDTFKAGLKGREKKRGGKMSTDYLHPYYVREGIKFHKIGGKYVSALPFFNDIMSAIEGHYGYWSSVPVSANLEDAQSREFIVYMADFFASRKISQWLDV